MHDWTLKTVMLDWKSGVARLELISEQGPCAITAASVQAIRMPRAQPWGASVSINTVRGPLRQSDGLMKLSIEMQSGDTIELLAASFALPISN